MTYMSHSSSRLSAKATYGLPWLSRVRSAKSADASCPKPPSKTRWLFQVAPSSSDHATHTLWNVSIWVMLQPVATLVATSAASQATYTRPACGPDWTTFVPPGMLLQNV